MWPDVLNAIAIEIRTRCAEADTPVAVYLGASAGVPRVDQINVVRGRALPGKGISCASQRIQTVYIEVWANPDRTTSGESDEETQNNETLPGYERLNALTELITAKTLTGANYRAQYIETMPDNDAFRPVCANRLEFNVTI